MIIREFNEKDLPFMIEIWNEVVKDGAAFPQEDLLDLQTGKEFFGSQSYCGVAVSDQTGEAVGLYILHPNNVGRCGHICNASYAVKKSMRGKHMGEMLVKDSLSVAKNIGFKIIQFNAVVETNTYARHLYEKLGFIGLGVIPKGFRDKNGDYLNICPYYKEL